MCLYFEMKNQEITNVYIKNMYQLNLNLNVKTEKQYHHKSTKDLYLNKSKAECRNDCST